MKKLLLISSAFVFGSADGQITLTSANQLMPGNVYYRDGVYNNLNPSVQPGNAGPSQTWNFSNAGMEYQDTMLTMSTGWLPPYVSGPHPQCNAAIQYGTDTSYYDMVRNDAGGFYLEASVYSNMMGVNHQYYSDPLKYMEWPCAYGTSWIDAAYSNYKYPTSPTDSAHQIINYTYDNEADAWGTLTIDAGTYNVLRIHRSITVNVMWASYDTSQGWSSFQTYMDTIETFEFWTNASGIGWPVAGMTYDMGVTDYYTMGTAQVGVNNDAMAGAVISVFPNPATDRFTMNAVGTWELYNVNGEAIRNGVATGITEIDVAELASGVYMLGVTDETGIRSTVRVVVQH